MLRLRLRILKRANKAGCTSFTHAFGRFVRKLTTPLHDSVMNSLRFAVIILFFGFGQFCDISCDILEMSQKNGKITTKT